jgi:NAD-binding of NADP-dependent 3-hydroxyisobutyrate dehydrogenase
VGAGSRLKLVNNTLVAFAAEGVATAVALAGRLGLSAETVAEAVGGGPLVSPWQAAKLARIAKGEFSAQFALSLALKDVRLALQAADGDRFATFVCLAGEWQQGVDQGLGDQDLTVVTRMLERQGKRRDRPLPWQPAVATPRGHGGGVQAHGEVPASGPVRGSWRLDWVPTGLARRRCTCLARRISGSRGSSGCTPGPWRRPVVALRRCLMIRDCCIPYRPVPG